MAMERHRKAAGAVAAPAPAALIAALALWAAPAASAAPVSAGETCPDGSPCWHEASAGLTDKVDLEAVAVGDDGAVLAAGSEREADAATGKAAIYRYAGGEWHPEKIDGVEAPSSSIAGLAFGNGLALAVGEADGGPLLLVYEDGEDGEKGAWGLADVDVPETMTSPLTSVAASGNVAYAGDASGVVHRIAADAGGEPKIVQVTGGTLGDRPVNGIALLGPGAGFAVSDRPLGSLAFGTQPLPVYSLRQTTVAGQDVEAAGQELEVSDDVHRYTLMPELANTASAGSADLSAVAAATGATTVAIALERQGGGYWQPTTGTGNSWRRVGQLPKPAAADTVTANSVSMPGTTLTGTAVAGTIDGKGTVWRRGATWATDGDLTAAGSPLKGVFGIGADETWAVGASGTALRRYADPPPPPEPPTGDGGSGPGGDGGTGGNGSTGGGSTGDGAQASAAGAPSSPPSSGTRPAATTPKIEYVVDQLRPCTTRRLVSRVRVRATRARGKRSRRARGRLVVSFRLRRAARVTISAKLGKRTVGRTRTRKLKRGARRLVVRYRARRVPSRMRILARETGCTPRSAANRRTRRAQTGKVSLSNEGRPARGRAVRP